MIKYVFLISALFLLPPVHALSAPVEEIEGVVEEPDNAEVMPPETAESPAAQNKRIKKEEAEKAKTEKKEGPELETGFNSVVLEGLNKVTAHASRIEAPLGSTVRFGTLEIVARSCWKSAPEDRPENAALLEIYEIKQGQPPEKIFLGWMYSSSPGLSSLEHPFYDITLINCTKLEGGKL